MLCPLDARGNKKLTGSRVMKKLFYLSALLVLLLFSAGIVFAQADTVYVKALEQYEKGHYDKAIDLLKDFVSRRPEPSAYYLIGYALYKLKRFDEADDYFKQTYLIDPVFSPSTLEYFQKQSPEELEALEAFAKPSETGTQPQELVEVAPPVVEQEQAPASEPETAAPPTVAQTTPPQQAQPTAKKCSRPLQLHLHRRCSRPLRQLLRRKCSRPLQLHLRRKCSRQLRLSRQELPLLHTGPSKNPGWILLRDFWPCSWVA